jgi:phosphoribosyl 1,2-cyclic phosphodiesterase
MKLTIGGVRGSCPVAQPEFMRYGGETTSFLIEGAGGERILIDAGTGIRQLGQQLMKTPGTRSAWLFMTHYHLDHVVGLPMLPILYSPAWTLIMAAPNHNEVSMKEIMERILDRPFWPLQVEDLKADIRYGQLEGRVSREPFRCGGMEVRWCPLHHPGGCSAYRFDEPATGASLVVATDMEWELSDAKERGALESLLAFPSPADALIMDGQYTAENAAGFRGWGHSTWNEAVALSGRAKVRRLLITHHDPSADDEALDVINHRVQFTAGWASLAREGMTLDLPARHGAQQ